MLSERISEYIAWLDSNGELDMPSWMEGSEWHDDDKGTSETWEYVLLRQAGAELTGLRNYKLKDDLEAENQRLLEGHRTQWEETNFCYVCNRHVHAEDCPLWEALENAT